MYLLTICISDWREYLKQQKFVFLRPNCYSWSHFTLQITWSKRFVFESTRVYYAKTSFPPIFHLNILMPNGKLLSISKKNVPKHQCKVWWTCSSKVRCTAHANKNQYGSNETYIINTFEHPKLRSSLRGNCNIINIVSVKISDLIICLERKIKGY
jgi:hypothetical protein